MTDQLTSGPLIEKFIAMFGCDTARISRPIGKLFLIIGTKRRSEGEWHTIECWQYVPVNFDYIEERCIASGNTEDELIASAEKYKRLLDLPKDEAWAELLGLPVEKIREALAVALERGEGCTTS